MLNPLFTSLVLLSLLLAGLTETFSYLGSTGFERRSECRTAVVAREMLETGDYVLPTLNGKPRLEKPPLYYWAIVPFARAMNGVSETAARLPSIISATLLVLATTVFVWVREPSLDRLLGQSNGASSWRRLNIALLAGLLLVSMPGFWQRSGLADAESMLALSCFGVMGSLYWNLRRPHAFWLLSAYVFSALAMLIKGPVFIIFTWPAFLWMGRKTLHSQRSIHIKGLCIVALFALSWCWALLDQAPDAFDVFSNEVSMRFKGGAIHSQPFYFYAVQVFGTTFPVALWLPAAALLAWKRRSVESTSDRYLWVSVVLGLSILSLLQSKQSYYLMPLYPVLAIMVSDLVVVGEAVGGKLRLTNRIVLGLGGLVGALGGGVIGWYGFASGAMAMAALAVVALTSLLGRVYTPFGVMTWMAAVMVGTFWVSDVLVDPVRNLRYDQTAYFNALNELSSKAELTAALENPCFFYDIGRRVRQIDAREIRKGKWSQFESSYLVIDDELETSDFPGELKAKNGGHGGSLWLFQSHSGREPEKPLLVTVAGRWQLAEDFLPLGDSFGTSCGNGRLSRRANAVVLELDMEGMCPISRFVSYLNSAHQALNGQLAAWKILVLTGGCNDRPGEVSLRSLRSRVVDAMLTGFVKHEDVSLVVDSCGNNRAERVSGYAVALGNDSPATFKPATILGVAVAGDRLWIGELAATGDGSVKRERIFRRRSRGHGLIAIN